ncbi:hypothetical protein LU699_05430 [Luteimonas fraxinea]|uniref:LysR substrate-binding domain-containing protein n=1 Tax=Luteimonas fraxinea TaxID=2901869 RepID=A0ABS8U7M4_9GAMM|nr:hypothetical protein [Luteimonas fraxinea]MCD9095646.1 hypothetical protein [Luteimonas fraxinea]MCD9124228.1 hypothetical protein [Luteimonas fraxinea]UHH11162.1 hypothetical protein LU699_05430 [Luteimonas fraxinea]
MARSIASATTTGCADWSPTVPGPYLYYAHRRHMRPALRAFIDCLLDRDLEADQAGAVDVVAT